MVIIAPTPGGGPEDEPDSELPAADHDPGGELPTVPTLVVDHDHEDADAIDNDDSEESDGGDYMNGVDPDPCIGFTELALRVAMGFTSIGCFSQRFFWGC